jgi:hypothetical protein
MKSCPLAVIVAALLFLDVHSSYGLPRFAVRTGAKCQSCHVDPSGGAMRQPFGLQYGREQLPVPAWSKDFEVEDFSNILTNVLGVGADFRMIYFSQQFVDTAAAGGKSTNDAFFQMQGDLYLNFHVAKRVNLFLNKGLYSGFEIFGLFNILPANGHIKAGKFLPNFGTRLDDHTTYIRNYTGFSPERGRPELTGVEIGFQPGSFGFTGGVYNAVDGFGAGTGSNKAFLGRAEGMFKISTDVNFGLGANVFSKKDNTNITNTLVGGFGSLSYQSLALLGEVDMIRTSSVSTTKGLVAYIEGDCMITSGLDLKLGYDFYDPDIDLKTGSLARYTAGFEFFPLSGVELRPLFRVTHASLTNVNTNEFDVLLHIYI